MQGFKVWQKPQPGQADLAARASLSPAPSACSLRQELHCAAGGPARQDQAAQGAGGRAQHESGGLAASAVFIPACKLLLSICRSCYNPCHIHACSDMHVAWRVLEPCNIRKAALLWVVTTGHMQLRTLDARLTVHTIFHDCR